MRTVFLSVAGCLILAFSGITLAGCFGGGCGGEERICDPMKSDCQCSDPLCNKPMYTNCISRGYCCEAFGNIGAR